MMLDTVVPFLMLTLAAYRVTFLITQEDGPFDIFLKVHNYLGEIQGLSLIAKLIDCFYCLNFWVCLTMVALYQDLAIADLILNTLAMAGLCCIIFDYRRDS